MTGIRLILAGAILFTTASMASAQVRLKDLAYIKDQQEIQIKGLGLVTGLDGTGDGKNTQFTVRMIANMMQRMGIEVPSGGIKVKNVAAVMVTATISPYLKPGATFDVSVSSIGDAKSIEGGTLLLTVLSDNDDMIYAKAQGSLSIGGANRDYGGADMVENASLAGVVSGGGILEREPVVMAMDERSLTVMLRQPDYTTAFRLATALNKEFGETLAQARDAGSLTVTVPQRFSDGGDLVRFIADMEKVTVIPDVEARVVINERTGTIIAGGGVSLAPAAILHGTLSLTISEEDTALAQGTTNLIQNGRDGDRMVAFREAVNVSQIVRSLNALGVTPRDLIAIFQALKAAGSLRAELIII